jgi:hypothetical protein
MVVNSQEVYKQLLLRSPDPNVLKFNVLALVAKGPDGSLDDYKLKELIRMFRPDRDGKSVAVVCLFVVVVCLTHNLASPGNLSLLDFLKTVDGVYKEAKLLRASVANSETIDQALEGALNCCFYTILGIIILEALGFDILTIFYSLSSLIVAVAWMVGAASAKMFEGWLFILVRRPVSVPNNPVFE